MDELKIETINLALVHLSEKTRYIFLLHRFEALSDRTIATKLAVSGRSVEDPINHALDSIMQTFIAWMAKLTSINFRKIVSKWLMGSKTRDIIDDEYRLHSDWINKNVLTTKMSTVI